MADKRSVNREGFEEGRNKANWRELGHNTNDGQAEAFYGKHRRKVDNTFIDYGEDTEGVRQAALSPHLPNEPEQSSESETER